MCGDGGGVAWGRGGGVGGVWLKPVLSARNQILKSLEVTNSFMVEYKFK